MDANFASRCFYCAVVCLLTFGGADSPPPPAAVAGRTHEVEVSRSCGTALCTPDEYCSENYVTCKPCADICRDGETSVDCGYYCQEWQVRTLREQLDDLRSQSNAQRENIDADDHQQQVHIGIISVLASLLFLGVLAVVVTVAARRNQHKLMTSLHRLGVVKRAGKCSTGADAVSRTSGECGNRPVRVDGYGEVPASPSVSATASTSNLINHRLETVARLPIEEGATPPPPPHHQLQNMELINP